MAHVLELLIQFFQNMWGFISDTLDIPIILFIFIIGVVLPVLFALLRRYVF